MSGFISGWVSAVIEEMCKYTVIMALWLSVSACVCVCVCACIIIYQCVFDTNRVCVDERCFTGSEFSHWRGSRRCLQ